MTVNYGGGGSGKGKTDLAGNIVQWAGTDSTIKPETVSSFKGGTVLYFPTVAAPITVSYNLSGVTGLKLSADTLGGIMSSQITKWNDSAIAADNPGVTLPSTAITVVHRSDASGTTNQFTHYLTLAATKTAWSLGTGDTVQWSTSTKAGDGNSGVAQLIKSTSGAVGYVDYADAKASSLSFASIKNSSGSFVAPTPRRRLGGAGNGDDQRQPHLHRPERHGGGRLPDHRRHLGHRVPEADGLDHRARRSRAGCTTC